jgi:hypothetical protein
LNTSNFQSQLPVRRLSHPSPARTWDIIRHELETCSLVFPSVAFILEDINTQNASDRKKRIIRIPKVRANITLSIFMLNLCCPTEQLNS